jgi:hypothetical protein
LISSWLYIQKAFVRLSFPYEELVKSTYTWGNKCASRFGALGGMLSWNARQAASAGGYDKTVDLLLSKSAEVNAQGGLYDTALQTAFIAEKKQTRGGCHALTRARSGREGSNGIVKERVCFGLDLSSLGRSGLSQQSMRPICNGKQKFLVKRSALGQYSLRTRHGARILWKS